MEQINFDLYLTAEIHRMIADGTITNQDVVDFYGNDWWEYINE